jgi:hypothetical protein
MATNQIPSDAPEFESLDAFLTYILDDERETCTPVEAVTLANRLGRSPQEMRQELAILGVRCVPPTRH